MEESAAKRRAAARREAILGSKGNRLAKLTSSARGEDAAGLYDDPPVPTTRSSPAPSEVPGAELSQTPRPISSATPLPGVRQSTGMPSASSLGSIDAGDWGPERQQQMMNMLMGSLSGGGMGQLNSLAPGLTPPGANTPSFLPGVAPSDPFAAMMAQLASGQQPGAGMPPMPQGFSPPGLGMTQGVAVARKRSRLEKLFPLLHMAVVLALLGYFVIGYEAAVFGDGNWVRWASLRRSQNDGGVHPAPIFFAFTTVEVVLHSLRMYLEPAPHPPSGIIGMVIANLPPPLPAVIATGSKYLAIGGAVLDDLSVLLFGVGLIVWYAGWAVR